jgi:ArsR family transcriptional regulator
MHSGPEENKHIGPPDFEEESKIFSALCVPIRLKILDMISCQEMCACNILENLSISQPTLSHHMKILMKCGLVLGRKDSTWMYYSINQESVVYIHNLIDRIVKDKDDCICYDFSKKCERKKRIGVLHERN